VAPKPASDRRCWGPRWTACLPKGASGLRAAALAWGVAAAFVASSTASAAREAVPAHPAPDPPVVEPTPRAPRPDAPVRRGTAVEWVLHKTADGTHPDAAEQQMVWLTNRARQDPTDEGLWLATSSHPDIAFGRSYFNVDLDLLQIEFAALEPAPPAAFDRRIYEAARLHAEDLIARDAQDHVGQIAKLNSSGFVHAGARFSVFSYADSALNAHAALNIDWGPGDGTGMQPDRGHRMAIMLPYDNVGLAVIPEGSGATAVGPNVFAGDYAYADTGEPDHYARFLVGTVWRDEDEDGFYDPGEGRGGVTVMPDTGGYYAVTAAGGGYAIPITAPGTYEVSISGGGVGTHERSAVVGADSVLLDLALPVPEPSQVVLALVGVATLGLVGRRRSVDPDRLHVHELADAEDA
jgi:hypothetical protein